MQFMHDKTVIVKYIKQIIPFLYNLADIIEAKRFNEYNNIISNATILDKVFETNLSFYVTLPTTRNVQFPFSSSFVLELIKLSFWKED